MDVEYPYADSAARLRLLYRLLDAPAPGRLLVVGDDADARLIGAGWPAPSSASEPPAEGSACFDIVALPWVLGRRADAGRLLADVLRLLVPGGVVVGHLEHRVALRRLLHLGEQVAWLGGRRGAGTAPQCMRALQRAGFHAAECFLVQPNMASPMGLVPCEPAAARAHFLRSARATQGQQGPLVYSARVALAALGLGGLQQGELFFWARKPC